MTLQRFLAFGLLAALAAALSSSRQAHAVACSPFAFGNGATLSAAALNNALSSAAQLG